MKKQVSIKEKVKIEGANVFPWPPKRTIKAIFHPAEDNTGIVFIVNNKEIPAKLDYAFNHRYPSKSFGASLISLRYDSRTAVKVEHLLSAVYGLGINNLYIELSHGICPRTDHGTGEIVEALSPILQEGGAPKKILQVALDSKISTNRNRTSISVKKAPGTYLTCSVSYPHFSVGQQELTIRLDQEAYEREIMHARPIFFLPFGSRVLLDTPLRYLHGIRDENSLLIGNRETTHYLNDDFPNGYDDLAFARHKIMDEIGTLALTGAEFENTQFEFRNSYHSFDLQALKEMFQMGIFREQTSSSKRPLELRV